MHHILSATQLEACISYLQTTHQASIIWDKYVLYMGLRVEIEKIIMVIIIEALLKHSNGRRVFVEQKKLTVSQDWQKNRTILSASQERKFRFNTFEYM